MTGRIRLLFGVIGCFCMLAGVVPPSAGKGLDETTKKALGRDALTKHDVTIRTSVTPFRDWYLEHDAAAKSESIHGADCSRNLRMSKQMRYSGYWKMAATEKGYLILAQDSRYDGWYLSFDPRAGTEGADEKARPRKLQLRQQIDPLAYWKLTDSDEGYLIQPHAEKFAKLYLSFDPKQAVQTTFQGNFSHNLMLTEYRTPAAFWNIQPNNDRAGRRHRPVVGQYLVTVAARLDCYFTIETYRGSSVFVGSVDHPNPAIASIEELMDDLPKQIKGVEVVRNRTNPAVIHLIEKPLSKKKNYVLTRKVDLKFSGVIGDKLCSQLNKIHPDIGPPRGGFNSDNFNDYVTKVTIDVKQQPIRDVLTHGLPLEHYSRIVWRAKTWPDGSRIESPNATTNVWFFGPRR